MHLTLRNARQLQKARYFQQCRGFHELWSGLQLAQDRQATKARLSAASARAKLTLITASEPAVLHRVVLSIHASSPQLDCC